MNLAKAISEEVVQTIRGQLQNLNSSTAELRAVFNGPPEPFLTEVYERLVEGGGLAAQLGNGEKIRVPVLLLRSRSYLSSPNPPIGVSGYCDHNHILSVRNAPECPRFIVLSGPGHQSSLSQDTTWFYCGLSPQHQAANTPIDEWIRDEFIETLISLGARRLKSSQQEWEQDVSALAAVAIRAADAADEANGSKQLAWTVLARLHSLDASDELPARTVSLALGFPPLVDQDISASQQIKILQKLADQLEDGFGVTIGAFKEQAEDEGERVALDDFLAQLVNRCSTATAVTQSMAYFYAPYIGTDIGDAPAWWSKLTLERWQSLLEQASTSPESLEVKCFNPLTSVSSGIAPVVRNVVSIEIAIPGDRASESRPIQIVRDSGSALTRTTWNVSVAGRMIWEDPDPPTHKRPLKYTVSCVSYKPTSVHVISIENFSPGLIVCGRDTRKATPPKPPKTAATGVELESSLTLKSEGRQYLTVFAKPGIVLDSKAVGLDADREGDEAAVSAISDVEYGLEILAASEKIYDLQFTRDGSPKAERLRIYISCDDVQAELCSSEFERLVLLNRSKRAQQGSAMVHVNSTSRSADLQSWMLTKPHSYSPLVFGPDYATNWRARNWESPEDTIISGGRFLSDPRPPFSEMLAPPAFIEAREAITNRILSTESGLLEGAPLAVWLSNPEDPFLGWLEQYLKAYTDWLAQSPAVAAWCDLSIITSFEGDKRTLAIEPHAVLISPLHPVRLSWQACAQKVLWDAYQKKPCPGASIIDPRCVPDSLTLPIHRASGDIRESIFFSLECSSDYWGVLWNSRRADMIGSPTDRTPFDAEFGVKIGGLASSFSSSQVNRSMNDVSALLSSKPVLNVAVTSASAQNDSTNVGLIEWSRRQFGRYSETGELPRSLGRKYLRVLDQRPEDHRPTEAEISNLAEDTDNSVNWYKVEANPVHVPDLTIVAQLEASNMSAEKSLLASPLSTGGLFRIRVREQLKAGSGAFLSESRVAGTPTLQADGLFVRTAKAIAHLENIGQVRHSYVFAPSVHALRQSLETSRYVAVSSSAIDPACFLGGWLDDDTYLWDYDLPSYSSRAGDSNGYYLLAKISSLDRETLRNVIRRLPDTDELSDEAIDNIIFEVARRGIPTVRGLSGGDTGAIGDLGLFVAARLLQDEFRIAEAPSSLFPVWKEVDDACFINLLIPIDPFQNYLEEISRVLGKPLHRPDLLLLSLSIRAENVTAKLVPIEVKFRTDRMPAIECASALGQAKSFADLVNSLREQGEQPGLLLWKLAYTHLQLAFVDYGFRVYSQQRSVMFRGSQWAQRQAAVMKQIIEGNAVVECDTRGRLILIDGSAEPGPRDIDGDKFFETINLSQAAAATIVAGEPRLLYTTILEKIRDWGTITPTPTATESTTAPPAPDLVQPSSELLGAGPSAEPLEAQATQPTTEVKSQADSSSHPPEQNVRAALTPGIVIKIGFPLDSFDPKLKTLNICDTNLNQMNVGVVGDLGTGKTQLLKSLVFQITQQRAQNNGIQPNILILDYKRDYSAVDFVQATGAKVVRPQNLKLNLFDLSQAAQSMTPWVDRFNFFADVLDKVYSGIGPVQRSTLRAAVRSVYQGRSPSAPPTIYDVHAAYVAATNGRPDSVSSIIEDMVDRELFCADAAQASTKDFLNGVVVISLDALGQADQSKNLVVAIMLNLFFDNMLRIEKRAFYGTDPQRRVIDSFLLVDEADNIMQYEFDVLRKILLQGREFGVGVILASQYLSHFKARATDYREMLLTWLVHKVPNVLPTELNALGMIGNQTQTAERIKALALHQCLYKTFNVGGEFEMGLPFYKLLQST
jgi:hypothetical protein